MTDGVGLIIYPALGPVTISIDTHGDLVRKRWMAVSAAAQQTVVVFETQSGSP